MSCQLCMRQFSYLSDTWTGLPFNLIIWMTAKETSASMYEIIYIHGCINPGLWLVPWMPVTTRFAVEAMKLSSAIIKLTALLSALWVCSGENNKLIGALSLGCCGWVLRPLGTDHTCHYMQLYNAPAKIWTHVQQFYVSLNINAMHSIVVERIIVVIIEFACSNLQWLILNAC